MPFTDMAAFTATGPQPMEVMVLTVLVTDMARGLLMLKPSLRLMPFTDMAAFTATDSQPMEVMVPTVLGMDTARGPLMLSPRLMPFTDMVASTATESQPMAVMATDSDFMERSKQYQIPRLTISYNTPNDLTGLYKHP